MLTVASSLVREAAGSPVLEAESTVELVGFEGDRWLDLPGQPVTAVSAVEIDGDAVTDYRLRGGRLWRLAGWSADCEPSSVSVSMTHGLADVPPHVVQLVCDLALAGIASAGEGAKDPRVLVESVDDYAVTFVQSSVATAMELPELTRRWLRRQFGGGAGVVTYR